MATQSKKARTLSQAELVQLTSEKDYVPQSAGLAQGARGPDVARLQRYLLNFGYMQAPNLEPFGAETRGLAEPPAALGVFDDNTVQALASFQQFNGLPVTSELDEATLELMNMPRCGFPDVAEFVLQGSKWNKTNLTYGYQNFTTDLTQAQTRAAIAQAFGLWSAVTPLTFTEVPMGSNPDIVIRFVAGNHGDGNNFDGPGGVLAHAYWPPPGGGVLAGDAHFDEAETWSVNLPPSGIDLVTVAGHEFGHILGLAHSQVNGALMYAYYGGPHRQLQVDDLASIQALYGGARKSPDWEGTVLGAGMGMIAGRDVTPIDPRPEPLRAEQRYLNAGFFTASRDDKRVVSEQPLSLTEVPYRLGVNVGEFWGLGTPGTPIPDDVLKPLFDQQPELTLDVALRSFTVALPTPYQPLPLAASGNSKMLFFPVEFSEGGRHTIEIDLIYCGHLLQSRRVEAYVVEHTGDPVPQSALPVQDAYITFTRTAALDPKSLKSLAERPSQLTVVAERSQNYNRVGLRFYRTSAEVKELGFEQSEITDANLVKRLKAARKQLKTTMDAYVGGIGGSEQQLTTQLGKLADVGRSFYCALLPGLSNADRAKDTRKKLLASLKPGAIIQVAPLSAQLSVPWELLYERPLRAYKEGRTRLCPDFRAHGPEWADCPHHKDPFVVCPHGFWGYRYIIEQLPCRSERSDPPKLALPMYVRNGLPLKLVALIYPRFNNWQAHWQALTHLAPKDRLEGDQRDTLDTIFAALNQHEADVLYIYAHGGQDDLGRPCLKVANDDLIVEQDLNAEDVTFEATQPLIVMNACESASYSPEDFESFILYFCNHGAAGVIGAQCSVAELLVDGMMTRFMAEFLKQTPAGESLYLARRSLLFGAQPDPRGLVYSLFAAADLKVAQAVSL